MFGTVVALIRGMIEGVTKGFEKELIIAYSHFPMNVKVEGNRVVIENFIGERGKRYANIVGDTKVEVSGDRIRVSGPDKYAVGQTAANISSACNLSDYDRRVFQEAPFRASSDACAWLQISEVSQGSSSIWLAISGCAQRQRAFLSRSGECNLHSFWRR